MTTDSIADMLTRIRNANERYSEKVDIPCSRIKLEIARILRDQGFIKNYKLIKDNKQGIIRIYLKYGTQKERVIENIIRVSKPSVRVFASAKRLPKVLDGAGIAIISTSKGVLTDHEARIQKVGGEVLCKIW